MRFFFNDNKQITRYSVVFSGITFSVYCQLHTFGYSGRDFYFHHFFAIYDALTRTNLTFVFDDFTFTVTLGAYTLRLHHSEDTLLGACHTACSVTSRTRFRTSFSFGT